MSEAKQCCLCGSAEHDSKDCGMREGFEAWFADYHNKACNEYGGLDCTNPKGIAEDAWQAARAQPAEQSRSGWGNAAPDSDGKYHIQQPVNVIKQAAEKHGVPYPALVDALREVNSIMHPHGPWHMPDAVSPFGRVHAQPEVAQPAEHDTMKLAEMVLSDCGCSTAISDRLQRRVAERIQRHIDGLLNAQPAGEVVAEVCGCTKSSGEGDDARYYRGTFVELRRKLPEGTLLYIAPPAQVPMFVRKRIERAISEAVNPKGMSVHDGMARVPACDLQMLLNGTVHTPEQPAQVPDGLPSWELLRDHLATFVDGACCNPSNAGMNVDDWAIKLDEMAVRRKSGPLARVRRMLLAAAPQPDGVGDVDKSAALRLLVASGNRIEGDSEEGETADGMTVMIPLDSWHEFAEALDSARALLAKGV